MNEKKIQTTNLNKILKKKMFFIMHSVVGRLEVKNESVTDE
jgi:hypothetical protein